MEEIVHEVTDGGRRIVEFYLGVADGSLDGFEDRHRMSAARRLDKIAPGLVARYLQRYYNDLCRDSYRGNVLPVRRSPIRQRLAEDEGPTQRGPNLFQRKLAQLVRQETGDGRAIVYFMAGVMHGTHLGFKPYHRMEAAKELAAYITSSSTEEARGDSIVVPAKAGTQRSGAGRGSSPSPSTEDGQGEGDSPVAPANAETQKPGDSTVTPAEAGVQKGGAGRGSSPSPSTEDGQGEGDSPVAPANAGTGEPGDSAVTPAEAGVQKGGAGRGSSPSPSTGEGWGEGDSPVAPANAGTGEPGDSTVTPAEAGVQKGGAAGGSSPSPSTGDGQGEGDSPVPSAEETPAPNSNPEPESNGLPSAPSASSAVDPKPRTKSFPPITIEEIERYDYDSRHITSCKFARDQATGAVYAIDDQGPFVVDDDGAVHHISPDLFVGYGNAPWQTFEDSDLQEWIARKGSGIKLITGPSDLSPRASDPQLTPTERRIRQRLKDYWHEPDPWGAPIDSASPARSPPW